MLTHVCISNGIGLALLIMLLITNNDHFIKEKRTKHLFYMIYVSIASCGADIIAYAIDGKPGVLVTVLIYVVNSWLFFAVLLVTYFWLRLGYDCIGASISKTGKNAILTLDLIGTLVLVVNLFYPLVFSVENNVYKRGPFYWIYVVIGACNLIYGIASYYVSMKKGKLLLSFSVSVFAIPTVIAIALQSLFYGLSLIWCGIAIAVVGLASAFKNKLIYYDSLTHVYNAYYLQELAVDLNKKNVSLAGITADINGFKKLNDTCGHDTGDRALMAVADIFFNVTKGCGTVIRRGGDEFVVLIDSTDNDLLLHITKDVERRCQQLTEFNQIGCPISVSMGCLKFNSKEQRFEDFLKELDSLMYRKKQEYHHFYDDDGTESLVRLGNMTVSSSILAKSNIGLWAFELDEGAPPRMYVDDTMLGLIGLYRQISPEETYHAWYDHVDEASYDLVAEAVAKMTDGQHAEAQYPWHAPDGSVHIVRCGGIRNPRYTKGVRIEGVHQDVSEVIHLSEES